MVVFDEYPERNRKFLPSSETLPVHIAAALPSLEYLLITHKRNARDKGNRRMYGRCLGWRVVACGAPDLRAAGTVSGGTFMLEEMNSREAASFRDCEGLNVD